MQCVQTMKSMKPLVSTLLEILGTAGGASVSPSSGRLFQPFLRF